MSNRSSARAVALLASLALALGGCQSVSNFLSGSSGVLPDSDIGPPPSMRGEVKSQTTGVPNVDEDGRPLPSTPTRQITLPKTVGGAARNNDVAARRINRDEIDGGNAVPGGRGGSGSMGPTMTQGGGVGVGGKF